MLKNRFKLFLIAIKLYISHIDNGQFKVHFVAADCELESFIFLFFMPSSTTEDGRQWAGNEDE